MYAGSSVEYANVERVYNNPLHPYTVGLFNSIPSLDEDKEKLDVIPGTPPNPSDLPSGCKFHPRCAHCMEICKEKIPTPIEVEEEHFVSCFLYDKDLKEEK